MVTLFFLSFINIMQDLHHLLQDQLQHLPIEENQYFYNSKTQDFYFTHYGKIKKTKGIIRSRDVNNVYLQFIVKNGAPKIINKNKLLCYLQNGIPPDVDSIFDKSLKATQTIDGKYKWISTSDIFMKKNRDRLKKVYEDHPDLYIKKGFYDEGAIPYKHREGFFIVPTTNATVAINPHTQEAVSTYSNELLSPRFHERGDRKYALNSRLTDGKHTLIASRAIAFVAIPIPDKYKRVNSTIEDIVDNLDVDHIDSNPSNNSVNNLQYLSRQENLVKKLQQEVDPRVYPTTWLNPNNEEVRFRSYREASQVIDCNLVAIDKVCKGWRKVDTIKGWKLIEGKIEHPLEDVYRQLESLNVDRTQLTWFKNEYAVYNIVERKFYMFKNIDDLCSMFGIFVSGLETHLAVKGPLVPYRDLVIYPYRYTNQLILVKYLDRFVN